MRVALYRHSTVDGVIERIRSLSPRTIIVDVEPLVAYWDTDCHALNDGLSGFLDQIAMLSSIELVVFATNSHRRPTFTPLCPGKTVIYRSTALKPFRPAPFRRLPAPAILVGDQVATDGLLASRLGYPFVWYQQERQQEPFGPRIMNVIGRLILPHAFDKVVE